MYPLGRSIQRAIGLVRVGDDDVRDPGRVRRLDVHGARIGSEEVELASGRLELGGVIGEGHRGALLRDAGDGQPAEAAYRLRELGAEELAGLDRDRAVGPGDAADLVDRVERAALHLRPDDRLSGERGGDQHRRRRSTATVSARVGAATTRRSSTSTQIAAAAAAMVIPGSTTGR